MRPYDGYSVRFEDGTILSAFDDGVERFMVFGRDEWPLTAFEFEIARCLLLLAHYVLRRRRDADLERDYWEPYRVHENRCRLAMLGREE